MQLSDGTVLPVTSRVPIPTAGPGRPCLAMLPIREVSWNSSEVYRHTCSIAIVCRSPLYPACVMVSGPLAKYQLGKPPKCSVTVRLTARWLLRTRFAGCTILPPADCISRANHESEALNGPIESVTSHTSYHGTPKQE